MENTILLKQKISKLEIENGSLKAEIHCLRQDYTSLAENIHYQPKKEEVNKVQDLHLQLESRLGSLSDVQNNLKSERDCVTMFANSSTHSRKQSMSPR